MSLIGEILGYGLNDADLMGYPRDPQNACVVCGISVHCHTQKMQAECEAVLGAASEEAGRKEGVANVE